ncbi:MAG: transketolase [Ruminococcaceae bacterium]|nr:transketolase [Oscillospiraceae bacterium]MBQ4048038.1 transketolase [Clostridia bacterium]
MDKNEALMLREKADDIRALALKMFQKIGKGHVGGAMSISDLLSVLYFKRMNINPAEPKWADRDRLVLSKGHAGPALYATLALRGFFPEEECMTLNQPGTNLPSHCDMNKTIGIDMTAGSLAQGFSAAIGMALACRLDKRTNRIYTIIGDGESQEGQIWEAAMYAGSKKLANITAFCDNNGMQIDGLTNDINTIEPVADKWRAFNWNVLECDGHDVESIDAAIAKSYEETERPTMIVMKTIKGKGANFCEGTVASHSTNVTAELLEGALAALNRN